MHDAEGIERMLMLKYRIFMSVWRMLLMRYICRMLKIKEKKKKKKPVEGRPFLILIGNVCMQL